MLVSKLDDLRHGLSWRSWWLGIVLVLAPACNLRAGADDWVRLGDAFMQHSRESRDPANYERAAEAYQHALGLEPRNVQALLGLAWVHNTVHDFDAGRRYAEAALEIDSNTPEAHALLGDGAVELGDYDTAFSQYQSQLDLRPDLASYSRAAHLLWLTGNATKARWLMQKAIDAGSPYAENTAWCRAQLALMLFHSGALVSAERVLDKALKEAPGNPDVLAAAARIKTARKEYQAAIELYQKSIQATPTHGALAALVDLYMLTGQTESAQAQFDRVVAFHEISGHHDSREHSHSENMDSTGTANGPHTHYQIHGNDQLARFFADHDTKLGVAVREAQAAWQAFPNVMTADTLAWCLYRTGAYDEAAKMIRRALEHNTPLAEIHFHAGTIYAKLGNRPLAQEHLYHALNLNPDFHPIFSQIAVDTLRTLATPAAPLAEPVVPQISVSRESSS